MTSLIVQHIAFPGISVEDAEQAFEVAVQNGGRPVHQPSALQGPDGQQSVVSEVEMYGEVVMRFISGSFQVFLCLVMPQYHAAKMHLIMTDCMHAAQLTVHARSLVDTPSALSC